MMPVLGQTHLVGRRSLGSGQGEQDAVAGAILVDSRQSGCRVAQPAPPCSSVKHTLLSTP